MNDPFDILREQLVTAAGRRRRRRWPLATGAAVLALSGTAVAMTVTREPSKPLTTPREYAIELHPDLTTGHVGWCVSIVLYGRAGGSGCGPAPSPERAAIASGGMIGPGGGLIYAVVNGRVDTVELDGKHRIAARRDRALPAPWKFVVATVGPAQTLPLPTPATSATRGRAAPAPAATPARPARGRTAPQPASSETPGRTVKGTPSAPAATPARSAGGTGETPPPAPAATSAQSAGGTGETPPAPAATPAQSASGAGAPPTASVSPAATPATKSTAGAPAPPRLRYLDRDGNALPDRDPAESWAAGWHRFAARTADPDAPPADAPCALTLARGAPFKPTSATVLTAPPTPVTQKLARPAFLTCATTVYSKGRHRLRAAVLLDAHAPAATAPLLPGMTSEPAGISKTTRLTSARRSGRAWIMVYGADPAERAALLNALTARA